MRKKSSRSGICVFLSVLILTVFGIVIYKTYTNQQPVHVETAIVMEEDIVPEETVTAEEEVIEEPIETADPLADPKTEVGEISSSADLSEETIAALQEGIDLIEQEGNRCGFVLLDLNSGNTVMYDPDESFYSASTVKAFFAASLINEFPELLVEREDLLRELLVNSSNDAYQELADTYGMQYMKQWFMNAGVIADTVNDMYCHYSALEVAQIWRYTYQWFNENDVGEALGELYEMPKTSLFHELLGDSCTVRTKGGWIDYDDSFRTTADAGIIYDGDDPYILVLMTDVPSDFELLKVLGRALLDTHAELIVQEG